MVQQTKSQKIGLFVAPILPSFMSLTCSFTLMTMILRSKVKLATQYRRLIFGLSCFDVFYSFGSMVSSLPIPVNEDRWGAMGNRHTCNAQGFLVFLGSTGCPMYNLSLCIFYLSVLVFSIRAKKFFRYIEPLLHVFTILYCFITGLFLLARGYFNPGVLMCWIAAYPTECLTDTAIPCERGEKKTLYRWLFVGYPITFVFVVIIITMSLIIWRVHEQEKSVTGYRVKQLALRRSERESATTTRIRRRITPRTINGSKKNREVMLQALYYVLCYFATWILPITNNILDAKNMVPYSLRVMARVISPGQGVLNILVYTRPHVNALRRAYPDHSWLKAFKMIVMSGGDNDRFTKNQRS